MRISKTVSITLPPEMLSRAMKMAKAEHRTMSELVREALRHYESAGRMTEADIASAVKQMRRTLWPRYKRAASKRAKVKRKAAKA